MTQNLTDEDAVAMLAPRVTDLIASVAALIEDDDQRVRVLRTILARLLVELGAEGPFVTLPPFTRFEAQLLLGALQTDECRSERRPEHRLTYGSLRTALAEAIDNHHEPESRACRACGCTDDRACEGGCSWVSTAENEDGPLCSVCAAKLCPDCGVDPGRAHEDGCDVARCLHTGGQRLSCFKGHGLLPLGSALAGEDEEAIPGSGLRWCAAIQTASTDEDEIAPRATFVTGALPIAWCGCKADLLHNDCGDDVWTGVWPGVAECEEFGWWTVFDHGTWTTVDADAEGAVHDLNRLAQDGRWDREQRRYVLR